MRSKFLGLLAGTAVLTIAASAAQAADLPSRYAPPPIVAAVPVFTWTGFYLGVNAGYGWNTNDNDVVDPVLGVARDDEGGFVGGGQIGYNYQIGSFLIGLETDIQYADIGQRNFLGNNDDDGWFGTVRARAGFALDRALVYATGGLAYGDVGGGNNDTNTGWTLGGGVEYAFTNNLTAKVEGLYVNLDTDNDFGTLANNNETEFGVVRAGLNYKFNSY